MYREIKYVCQYLTNSINPSASANLQVTHRLAKGASTAIPTPEEGAELIAIADYSPLWFDELRLREGERVVFLSAMCPGWFKGQMGNKVLQKLQP